MWYDETGLPWVMPSPNMPTLDTATVYPGGCLIEGTLLSEGRGTTRPFEIIGAPYIDPFMLAKDMKEFNLKGVYFRPLYFEPAFQKHAGKICGGIQLHITDRNNIEPVKKPLWLFFWLSEKDMNMKISGETLPMNMNMKNYLSIYFPEVKN